MEKVDGTLMTLDFINNDEESLAWFLGLMRDWFGFELKVALFGEQSGDHMRVESYRDLIFVSAEDG
ncbi:MAG: hypothetical protein GWN30_27700 [Gammaproteobacteria bacterium]|nr:hypothetical protein [Gammaproteobacteria bacterium]NIW97871.1 hypothetical protein [Phycisphaerae bacterium]